MGNRNWAVQFQGCFEPFRDNDFGFGGDFPRSFALRHATGQFRNFDVERIFVFAPLNDRFVYAWNLRVKLYPAGTPKYGFFRWPARKVFPEPERIHTPKPGWPGVQIKPLEFFHIPQWLGGWIFKNQVP
jgi:hypothetical protein